MPPVGYIAYIDEAGDDGLRPKEPGELTASQWMVISAVLVKAASEPLVLDWVKQIVYKLQQHQLTHLHFRRLKDDKKDIVCTEIAGLNVRIFSVLSHKRNMIGYRNLLAEKAKVNRTAWFYCWMSRLLLEKVTAYCGRRSVRDYGEKRLIRFEFSDRGGVKIDDIREYYKYLRGQSKLGLMYHSAFDLDWSVFDEGELYTYPNQARAGLQLADSVASAFYVGLEPIGGMKTKPEFAKLLLPRIAADRNNCKYGFGVRTMPVWVMNLPPEQAELRDFYKSK